MCGVRTRATSKRVVLFLRARAPPSFSFLGMRGWDAPFRPGKRENNGSNLGRSQCTTCWCFLVDKALGPPVFQHPGRPCRSLAAKVHTAARLDRSRMRDRKQRPSGPFSADNNKFDNSPPPNLTAPIGRSRFFLSSSVGRIYVSHLETNYTRGSSSGECQQ
jgi:hypothetical protein